MNDFEIYEKVKQKNLSKKASIIKVSSETGLTVTTIKNAVRKEKKKNMTYNISHKLEKDRFTNDCIARLQASRITVLDCFAGKFSIYKDKTRCEHTERLLVIDNDLYFPEKDYQCPAKELLKGFIREEKIFDLIDLDAFNAQDAANCLPFALQITRQMIIFTIGQLDRCRHTTAVQNSWKTRFKGEVSVVPGEIFKRVNEIAQMYEKEIVFKNYIKFRDGTYRFCVTLKERD